MAATASSGDEGAQRNSDGGSSGRITVAGLAYARRHKRSFGAVLTVEDPACRPSRRLRFNRAPHPHHLVLSFEDVDDAGLGLRCASKEQVAQALEFGQRHESESLLIHCFHGVGRSAAVALAILADRLGQGREVAAVARLFELRPEATPNLVVIKVADLLLSRGGKLVEALRQWEDQSPDLIAARERRRRFVTENSHLYSRAPSA